MPKVKSYDLCRPKGFDRNDIRMLRNHLAMFARHAGVEMTTMLHRNCTVAFTGEIESPWEEFVEMMDRRPYLASFTLAPLSGLAVLAIPCDTATRMLEYRLGGGHGGKYGGHDQLTDCDYGVIGTVISSLIGLLAPTFGRARRLSAAVTRQVTDSQLIGVSNHADMFFVACFNLILGSDDLVEMFIALPFALVHQINKQLRMAAAVALTEEAPISKETVLTVPLMVDLEIPPVELTPSIVADLAVGDVIRLKHPISRPLDLTTEGFAIGKARLGRSQARLACLIVEEENRGR
ncbi:MAG TPA: FliM/FliN family flagellar motor switch protein [Acidimicrobiales bacterium]|nr:FliM/FliN family flagellar motor switch protein [Acidimicrobiales bacterium]